MKQLYIVFFILINSFSTTYAQNNPPLKDCKADFSWMTNGLTIMFHDASSVTQGGPINAWFWEFGDGTTSTLKNPVSVTLYNPLGQVLFQQNSIPESIDLQGFVNGIYFLKISGRVWRIVKE